MIRIKIAIIGNPTTDVSSGKFLTKFSKMLGQIFNELYVVNDGRLRFLDEKIHVINATRFNSRLRITNKSAMAALAGFLLGQIFLFFGLLKCIKSVNAVFILPNTMVSPAFLAKFTRKKIFLFEAQNILWEYVKDDTSGLLRFFMLWLSRRVVLHLSDCIIVEGNSVINQNLLNAYKSKVKVCHMHVDLTRYTVNKSIKSRQKLVGFIALITERKGILEFLNTISILKKMRGDLNFIIVGDGDLFTIAEKMIAEKELRGIVKIIKRVPEETFTQLLNDIRLFILPSRSEGLPNIIIEAMACGTPVLVTKVGAIPDVVKEGKTGFLLNSTSPQYIAQRISNLIDDENLLETVTENAQKFVNKSFGEKEVLSCWESVILLTLYSKGH